MAEKKINEVYHDLPEGYELIVNVNKYCALCEHPRIPKKWHVSLALRTASMEIFKRELEDEYNVIASAGDVHRHSGHVKVKMIDPRPLLEQVKEKINESKMLVENMNNPEILKEAIDALAALHRKKMAIGEYDSEYHAIVAQITRMTEVYNRITQGETINVKGDFKTFMVNLINEKGKEVLKEDEVKE